jgi:hypothetical protein
MPMAALNLNENNKQAHGQPQDLGGQYEISAQKKYKLEL